MITLQEFPSCPFVSPEEQKPTTSFAQNWHDNRLVGAHHLPVSKWTREGPSNQMSPEVSALGHVCVLSPTLCNPTDHNLPGSSVHQILHARTVEWVAMPFSRGIFPTQGSKLHLLHLLHWQVGSLPFVPSGKPLIPEWLAVPFSRGSSQPRDQTQVSHIAGGFFAS